MFLLDTCALLILAGKQDTLPPKLISLFERSEETFAVSSISAFEIALKYKLGKLGLPLPPSEWYSIAIEHHNIEEIPVDGEIGILAAELPFIHKDPCDRIIVATALRYKAQIITTDKVIPQYHGVKTIWD